LSPILGIIASQNYPRITNSYESIATVTVGGGGSSSISFSSIPSTFKHLQIRAIARAAAAQTAGEAQIRINSDSSSSYTYHNLRGNGSSVTADGSSALNYMYSQFRFTGGNDTANTFGAMVMDVLDYANTSKYKTIRTLSGYDANGSGSIGLNSSVWLSTSAITSITFENQGGSNWAEFSKFALYGIR
jgi:hypothetical protein